MIRFFPNEEFREIKIPHVTQRHYAISNKGRLISFDDEIRNGRLMKGGLNGGYRIWRFRYSVDGKTISQTMYFYKMVAELFIKRTSEDQKHVLHLDYNIANDDVSNLRWATREEKLVHVSKSPHVKRARLRRIELNKTADGWKLTATKVMLIKKILSRPDRKTRLKMLAKQFGVSSTQIKRIESGENWGHIKI
ncbi:MAG TPA: NUMOD4 domain-containing protein [Flavobacterium sp.]|jgi:hypothetical protein